MKNKLFRWDDLCFFEDLRFFAVISLLRFKQPAEMAKTRIRKKRRGIAKYFRTRREAYTAFKTDYDIPKSEAPAKVVKPDTPAGDKVELDNRNVRLYIFRAIRNLFGRFIRREIHLREDKNAFYVEGKGSQSKHFNAGYGGEKLKDHYYFEDRDAS